MSRLQVGGAVRPGAVYVERAADRELVEALAAGELCAVLAPRQIGKSSLMVRACARLEQRGVRTAVVDLTAIGTDVDARTWALGFADELAGALDLEEPDAWFTDERPVFQQWLRFLRRALLDAVDGPIVVFVDEIDAVLAAPFSRGDFFGAIRAAHNRRAADPDWARLTFCLLGAAAPWELASDPRTTPFNVGRDVALVDFDRHELAVLAPEVDREGWVDAVFAWTRGHPYMTLRLAAWLVEHPGTVDQAVAACFGDRGVRGEVTLASSERLLLADGGRLLSIYRRALEQGVVAVSPRDARAAVLTGTMAQTPEGLIVRNRIVAEVFDEAWVHRVSEARPHREAVSRWVRGGRRDGDLLRGSALEAFRDWSAGREDLDVDETELLVRSTDAAAAERAARARGQAQRIALISLTAVAAALAVGLIATGWSLREQRRATERADALRDAAQIELLTSVPGRQLEALEWAVELAGRSSLPEARSALVASIDAAAGTRIPLGAPVTRVACTPAGAFASTGSGGLLLDLQTGRAEPAAMPEAEPVDPRLYAPPGESWAELRDGEGAPVRRLTGGHDEEILAWEVRPHRVLTGADDDTATWWDRDSGRVLDRFLLHHGTLRDVAVCPGDQVALLASDDASVGVFRLLGGGVEHALPRADVRSAALGPGGQVVTVDATGRAEIWSSPTGGPRTVSRGHSVDPTAAIGPDGTVLVTDESYVARFSDGRQLPGWGLRRMPRFTPDGRAWLFRKEVAVLLGETETPFVGHTDQVTWAELSPDGTRVATGSLDGTVRLWDATGQPLKTLADHGRAVTGVRWSATGRLASYDGSGRVFLWSPDLGEPRSLDAHRSQLTHLMWSPDGARFATAGFTDNSVGLWSADGQLLARLEPMRRPRFVAFSPDGTLLASAGDDGALRMWDGATGAALGAWTGHVGPVRDLEFSGDGQLLMTLADDGWVRFFPATRAGQVDRACAWLEVAGRTCTGPQRAATARNMGGN